MSAERTPEPVAIIGAGLDLGAGRRGVDMGPSAIRYAGLEARIRALGREVADWGDVRSPVPEATEEGSERPLPRADQAGVREGGGARREGAVGQGFLPLVLGGDHSIAMGTLGGMAKARGAGAALWIDAHGDLNRPSTSPSGNVHGMPLAAALGAAGDGFASDALPDPVGAPGGARRDPLARPRRARADRRARRARLHDERGRPARAWSVVLSEALEFLGGAPFLHVSLDLDAVDPMFAPGVGTPVRGGLSYREAHLALELVAESGLLDSLDVVEVNPILDRENETGKLAVELVASALGARIL